MGICRGPPHTSPQGVNKFRQTSGSPVRLSHSARGQRAHSALPSAHRNCSLLQRTRGTCPGPREYSRASASERTNRVRLMCAPPRSYPPRHAPPRLHTPRHAHTRPATLTHGPLRPATLTHGPPRPATLTHGPQRPATLTHGPPRSHTARHVPPRSHTPHHAHTRPATLTHGPPRPATLTHGPPRSHTCPTRTWSLRSVAKHSQVTS